MSIGIDKLAHMNTPALSDILLAHSAAEGTGVVAIGDLPKLLNAGNLKMPDSDETIAEHYKQFCNRNLLDNWYFGNPVNQRGATEYIINRFNQYHIDRWTAAGNFKITLENDGLKITNTSDSVYANIMQRLEFARFGKKERTITLSLFTGDDLYSVTGTVSFQDQNGSCYFATPFGAIRMYTYNSLTEFTIDVAPGKETKIQAVKLELGSNQTLSRKENNVWVLNEIPDYATELAKCQRYFYKTQGAFEYRGIAISRWYVSSGTIELPVPMRIKPACKIFDRSGNVGKISTRNTGETVNGSIAAVTNRVVYAYATDANFVTGTEYDFAIEADANL